MVGSHQSDNAIIEEEAFQRRTFAIDKDSCDLTILDFGLGSDIDHIAILDTGIDHAVSFTGKSKISFNMFWKVHITFNILLSENGRAAGNSTEQRNAVHWFEGDEVGWHFDIAINCLSFSIERCHAVKCEGDTLHRHIISHQPSFRDIERIAKNK